MDFLEDYLDENHLTKANILKYIDDYDIYSKYINAELELYTKYSSPLRVGDEDPSFSLYYSKYNKEVIMFKDQSTGNFGDAFKFVQYLMGKNGGLEPLKNVLLQIDSDFKLELGSHTETRGDFIPQITTSKPLKREPVKLQITGRKKESQKYMDYWDNLEIPLKIRSRFYCTDVEVIHFIKENEPQISVSVRSMCVSYEIATFYKTYQPFEDRKYKFRNDYPTGWVEGAIQLKYEKNFCIITKSTKEIMFLEAHFGWEAVAGTSENSMISDYYMQTTLKVKYKRVFVWLDNDEAGRKAQQRYLDKYDWIEPIVFGEFLEDSDPTDLFSRMKTQGDKESALAYLKQLITSKL